jgi:uncharacterized membrane protein YgcG
MPDGTLADANFLPAKPPANSILDFSGSLSAGQTSQLEGVAHALSYQAKVVILPQNFNPTAFDQFARELAQQWQVHGNRLLIVVDLKGKHMRALPGKTLQAKGVDQSFLNQQVFPNSFKPYVKEGDVAGAIQNTLLAINTQVQSQARVGQTVESQRVPADAYGGGTRMTPASGGDNGWGVFAMLALVPIALTVVSLVAMRKKSDSNRLMRKELEEKSSALYQIADQLGQASEYLPRDKHPELAQKTAEFFSKLNAVEQAKRELEMMERQGKTREVRDGLLKIHKVVDLLKAEGKELTPQVSALTGGVQSSFAPIQEDAGSIIKVSETDKQRQADEDFKLRIAARQNQAQAMGNQRYYTPTWMSEPMYAPMMVNPFGGVGGMMTMAMLLNQMDMNRRLSDVAAHQYYQDHYNQNNWDNNNQNDAGSWGGDDGGSWGGGGSGGGDWGGGGDFGGGADFGGGGGGDW